VNVVIAANNSASREVKIENTEKWLYHIILILIDPSPPRSCLQIQNENRDKSNVPSDVFLHKSAREIPHRCQLSITANFYLSIVKYNVKHLEVSNSITASASHCFFMFNDKTYAVFLQISPYNARLISSFKCLTESFKMFITSSLEYLQHPLNRSANCTLKNKHTLNITIQQYKHYKSHGSTTLEDSMTSNFKNKCM